MQADSPTTLRPSHNAFQDSSQAFVNPLRSNPRFSYLQKWSEEDLANKENHASQPVTKSASNADSPAQRPRKPLNQRRGLGISISTSASTPSARNMYDSPISTGPTTVHRDRDSLHYRVPDDPFVVQPQLATPTIDLGELSRTLASLQMMMNHTIVRMDALAEKQHVFAEGIERLQTAVATNTSRIVSLEARQNAMDDASQMETLFEKHPSPTRDMGIAASSNTAVSKRDIEIDLWTSPSKVPASEARRRAKRTSRDLLGEKRVSTLSTTMSTTLPHGQTAAASLHKSRSAWNISSPGPRATTLSALQRTVEQQTAQIKTLVAANRDLLRAGERQTPAFERLNTCLDATRQRLDRLQSTFTRETETARRYRQDQNVRLDRLQMDLDRHAADVCDFGERMAESRAGVDAVVDAAVDAAVDARVGRLRDGSGAEQQMQVVVNMCCQMMGMMQVQQSRVEELVACRHDVVPPPRKMNRKLVGYVYSRGET